MKLRQHIILIFCVGILGYLSYSFLNIASLYGLFDSPRIQIEQSTGAQGLENEIILEEKKVEHIDTPQPIHSLYFTAQALENKEKRENFYTLAEQTEINSMTIDIKTVSGYTNFAFDHSDFSDITPESNNSIADIQKHIEELHEKGIYVIGRIVVFKDNRIPQMRPDLSIKKIGTNQNWTDYKGNTYSDPYAKAVWDYHVEMALAAYRLGFDEINFDYIRFPTDGYISQTSYQHAGEVLSKNPKWGKMIVIDAFGNYLNTQIKKEEPNAKISADIFGLVTNTDLFQIGQNLESFLLNFDFVGPMIYPSHYASGYLGYQIPDNAGFAIFDDSMKKVKQRIDALNQEIDIATQTGSLYQIKGAFTPDSDISKKQKISYDVMRPWLQGFGCSRCAGATPYNRTKFRDQIRGLENQGFTNRWVWSAGSNYYPEWYDLKDDRETLTEEL